MTLFRTITTCLLYLLFSQILGAQEKFLITHFGTENGLPSNGIKGLQWDEEAGFLWIATEAGIVRYNGIDFKTFTAEDDSHISNNRVLYLLKNNAGKIYTADKRGAIFKIDKNRLVYKEVNTINDSLNNHFTLNVSDKLYNHGITHQSGFIIALTYDKIIPLNDTSCLIIKNDLLYLFSTSLNIPEVVSLPGIIVRSGFTIGDDLFLVNDHKEIFKFELFTRTLVPIAVSFPHNSSLTSEDNLFFWENGIRLPILLNRNTMWQLNYSEGKLQARQICDTIPFNIRTKVIQYNENTNTIFLGTDSKGIYIIKKNTLESLINKNPAVNQRVSYYSQIELSNGNVLTNEGHIIGNNKSTPSKLPIDSSFSTYIYRAGDSVLWYFANNKKLGYNCLHKYDYKSNITKVFEKIRSQGLAAMTIVDNNLIIVNQEGIWKLVADSLALIDNRIQSESLGFSFDINEFSPGILDIATCNILYSYNLRNAQLDTIYESPDFCIRTLWVYKDYLFFGTYGNGLFIYKNGKVKALPLDKNKYLLFTHCFIEDDYGFCWISTNRGLFKVKIEDMIAAFESDATSVYYHYFGSNDGMVMTEMNGGCTPCAIELKNKTISFPTMEGLLWVDPEEAKPVLSYGKIFIDEISVNDKKISEDSLEILRLPAANGEIKIRLAYPAWENRENVYLWYQLDDTLNWKQINPADETLLRFVNLSPGDHHLRIRKLKGFGINNYTYTDIRFSVARLWFHRWWFYVAAGLLAFGIVWLIFRIRTNQYKISQRKLEKQVAEKTKELKEQNAILEKNDQIKTRLISIINHDIITPLKFLSATGNKLVERKKMMSPEIQDETILEMAQTSKELQTLSTNILNWIKYQNEGRGLVKESFNLYELAEQVLAVLGPVAHQKNIKIINSVPNEANVYQFFEPLKILLYNIVSNAINFSEKGAITINGKQTADHITLSITDEGIGMTQEQIKNITSDKLMIHAVKTGGGKGNGLGYLIIKDLLKVIGGTIKIESAAGNGTTISIRFLAVEKK